MRISHQYKFVFFSNPKTGSESVRALLDPFSEIHCVPFRKRTAEHPFHSHIRPAELKAIFAERGWDYGAYFKFTLVRNPWARMVSLYDMVRRSGRRGRLRRSRRLTPLRNLVPLLSDRRDFRVWVRGVQADGPGAGGSLDWDKYGSYSLVAFAGDGAGRLLVDEVAKLEDPKALGDLLRRTGIPGADAMVLPRINVHVKAPYASYYDDDTADFVGELYRDDIARFGYRFGA